MFLGTFAATLTLLVSICHCAKLDILGETFKKNVNQVKSWPQIDLIFLVDASSSVGHGNFLSELRFVRKLLSDLTVSNNHTKVAVVTFGSQDHVIVHVDGITNKEEVDKCRLLNDFLPHINYTGGGTYTLGAFQEAKKIILNSSRNHTKKAIFLITDGFSNGGDPIPISEELKNEHNVTVFSIGIKSGRGDELQKISSGPETCYLLHGFKEFESLARRALHSDLQDGEYVPVSMDKCKGVCDSEHAECSCGFGSGQYACTCKRGYYGDGEQCQPCPNGTWYRPKDKICIPCPDPHHESFKALSIRECTCKRGYKDNGTGKCDVVRCPELKPPENGYFVGVPAKGGKCQNVLNNACGVRCQVGYSLRGNSIRLCQENGSWTGIQPQCEVKTCTKPPVPDQGRVVECINKDLDTRYEGAKLPADMPVDTECTFGCSEGHTVTGSTLRTCLPVAQWDGLKTTCKPIRCHRLGKVAHGHWEPETCAKVRQPFGSQCKVVCKPGFVPNGNYLTCKSTTGRGPGKWNGTGTKCIDIEPPVIKCPKGSVVIETEPGSMYGIAQWNTPKVSDNSGLEVTVWAEPSEEEDHAWNEFDIGVTQVIYHAVDVFGNEATCNMTVEVVDTEPPVIENCESPPPFLTSDPLNVVIQWDEPLAYDNSQGPVEMTLSHQFGIFEVGTTEVTYTATDIYNNTNTCVINITVVAEASCETPPSGSSVCNPTPEGITCALTCQEGYGFALTDKAVCLYETPGIWDVPECTPMETPTDVWEVINAETECTDNETLQNLHTVVKEDGGVVLLSGCERTRRSLDVQKRLRQLEFHVKNTQKILDTAEKLGINATIGKPLIVCKNGSVPAIRHPGQKPRCVLCPKGTYYTNKRCVPCPLDTYSSKPGVTSCEKCPGGRSTLGRKRGKSKRACKVVCPTGTDKKVNTCESRPRKKISCDRPNVCRNGGKCISVGNTRHKCICASRWTGAKCRVRVRSCLCQNGGSCTEDGSTCKCITGFTGDNCELLDSDLVPETEVDEATEISVTNPCKVVTGLCENSGTCVATKIGGFECICAGGFIGRRCNILPCDYNPCSHNTVCTNVAEANATKSSFMCNCPTGRSNPPECLQLENNCESNQCLNGATCRSKDPEGYICECPQKYHGKFCELKKDPDYILHFPRSGINDFVIIDGPPSNLSEVSLCVWLQTADTGNYGTLLSYATENHDNAFTITDYSGLVLYVNDHHVVTDVRLNDGRWHHLCITWNMSKGAYSVYVDSKLETSGQGLSDGTTISGNGKIVLGQEQDALGGRFSRAESFIGKLSYMDLWNKVLTKTEITATMHGCASTEIGNIRTWADFRNGTQGLVHVEKSTFCSNCSSPPEIFNGHIELSDDGRTAVYSCEKGYVLMFEGSEVVNGVLRRQCTAASLWEGSREPKCEPVSCPYPDYVAHAQVIGSLYNLKYKHQLVYKCLPGYEPVEPQIRTCTENGTWSGKRPLCRGGQCDSFPKPSNSNITVTSEHVYEEEFEDILLFEVGTQLEVSCLNGAKLKGEKLVSCQENGTWDNEIPTCAFSNCLATEMPPVPPNGYTLNEISGVTFDIGTVISFKCRNGHKTLGNNFTECLSNGQWSHLNLTCSPIECVIPPKFDNMHYNNGYNIKKYYFGNMLKYECTEGYVFYGNNVIRCLANGKWTKLKGQCTRISCNKPEVPSDEVVVGNSYLYKDSVSVLCPEGSPNVEYTMKCTSTGKWLQVGDCSSARNNSDSDSIG